MPGAFAALENELSESCDEQFGEAFELRPMTAGAGGGRRTVDAGRAVKTVTGIFDDRSFNSQALGAVERTATQITLRHAWLSVDRRQFTVGQEPRRADRFARTGTGRLYEVAEIQEDGEGRFRIRLADVGVI